MTDVGTLEQPVYRVAVEVLAVRLREHAETSDQLAGLYATEPDRVMAWATAACEAAGGDVLPEIVLEAALFEQIRDITGRDDLLA